MTIERYLTKAIVKDLKKKMVFLGGPRQVGKTTCSNYTAKSHFPSFTYFNWDNRDHRKDILNSRWPTDSRLIILDEIHKYTRWKSFVKGEYDIHKERCNFFITGSARLDVYKKGGDSLLGRYHYYRLHSFSYAELLKLIPSSEPFKELSFREVTSKGIDIYNRLYNFGGFPEPYLEADETVLRRWRNERKHLLFKEDVRDLSQVRDLSSMEIMVDLLPMKVGSLLSVNSLSGDLEVTHKSVNHWLGIMEALYYCFRIYPFAHRNIRSLKKEPKLYLWDWTEIEDRGARLENLVACHLLKFCHFYYDALGYRLDLRFLRDQQKRELDFLVTVDNKPWFAVEVKSKDLKLSTPALYFKDKLNIPFVYQVVENTEKDFEEKGIRVISLKKFLGALI